MQQEYSVGAFVVGANDGYSDGVFVVGAIDGYSDGGTVGSVLGE